ncbi:MAG: protoporphyrinogen oxidase, partial [Pseudomonadota bacterium]
MKRIAVIGAGISGLATAYQLEKQLSASGVAHELRVFEKEARPGGKIGAARRDGFLCESGPNGFLDSKPSTLELCAELGISDRLLSSSEAARRRFILKNGRLREIPTAPLAFLRSDLMSLRGKLRMLAEPWAADPKEGKDQSISDFARRRLGSEALETLIEPMVGGVFAGNPDRLSLESCFPRIAELERTYGGLVKAMFKLQKERRRQRGQGGTAPGAGPAGPGGTLTSFREGLSVLPDTLAQRFGERLTCAAPLSAVLRSGNGFRLVFEGQADYECDCLILATPASDAAQALNGLDA